MSVTISDGSGLVAPAGLRRSIKSSTMVTASAGVFLMLTGVLSFVPDAPPAAEKTAWPLRGPLAATVPAQKPVPADVAGLRVPPKPV